MRFVYCMRSKVNSSRWFRDAHDMCLIIVLSLWERFHSDTHRQNGPIIFKLHVSCDVIFLNNFVRPFIFYHCIIKQIGEKSYSIILQHKEFEIY